MADTRRSLYERIGGDAAILAASEIFYGKVMDDPLTRRFFEELNLVAQTRKLAAFMAWAFGGPDAYKGRDLRTSHLHLVKRGLSDEHFDAVTRHLRATLEEMEVAADMIAEALAIVETTRAEVLNR